MPLKTPLPEKAPIDWMVLGSEFNQLITYLAELTEVVDEMNERLSTKVIRMKE
jgi:hypothetical protein